ncbi:MAG: YciI family protein [Micrococcales bacterium]
MAVFAVQYYFIEDADLVSAIRPSHREWSGKQLENGSLLASGPFVDFAGALLIFQSSSIEELNQLLDHDPYEIAGVLNERTITQWNPVFGPFSQK